MPPKGQTTDQYKKPFFKAALEKHEINEDIATVEVNAGIKRRVGAPARYTTQGQDMGRRGYDFDQ